MDDRLPHSIKTRLKQPLPGQEAQYRLVPFYRKDDFNEPFDPGEYRLSAVMVLLCCREPGKWFIPLTLRSEYAGTHSAQVSLPGGKYDDSDESLVQTALRECYEEIGLSQPIEVLGPLTTLHIPVSRFVVHPFVGVFGARQWQYVSHEREVKAIIELPLEELLNDEIVQSGDITVSNGLKVKAPYYLFEGHRIWGATAMILSELKQLLKESLSLR
jgi:8-oxo-dGTP pyrophosphatase MutT (NUDIX family)